MYKIKPVIRKLEKYRKDKFYKARFIYTKLYDKVSVKDNYVLLQSYSALNFSGNVYYILLELCQNKKYENLKKFVVCNKKNRNSIIEMINNKNLDNVEVVEVHTEEYCRCLLECKYLINNVTFPTYFMKKEEQIYLNTWHGTPLKHLGRKINDAPEALGNVQRNFMMADYLLYPNIYTFDHMREDYMLDNIYSGKYIISGYPRNVILTDKKNVKRIKEELEITDKQIIVYMPTWRGTVKENQGNKQMTYIMHMLYELENNLDEDKIVYVNLHSMMSKKVNFKEFTKIKPFPKEYETYEFLSVADCLITDYSSVFFDYANTGKKIVLYCYDEKDYTNERGMYLEYDKLPFPHVHNTIELLNELNDLSSYNLYKSFTKEYCSYDNNRSTKDLCSYVFNEKKNSLKVFDGKKYNNGKPNILIYGGTLLKNGITTSLKGLINHVDKSEYNYFLAFYGKKVYNNRFTINEFEDIDYLPIFGYKDMTFKEAFIHSLYFRFNINLKIFDKILDKIYQREIKRLYGNLKFEYVIHFTGYERHILKLFKNMDATRIMYVHNDMYKESKSKTNVHKNTYIDSLDNYDKIAVVSESARNGLIKLYPKVDLNKVSFVHNLNNIEVIKNNAKKDLEYIPDTYCNIEKDRVETILNNKELNKFIAIARFSYEKGLDRLINAFIKLDDKNSYLFIIGGYGDIYDEILNMIEESNNDRIIIIKSLANPYPILDKCDCYVLSSRYEGLPMTIMEALILDKTIISTDIEGPRDFLSQGYGYLVEDSEEGVYQGMKDYLYGKIVNLKKFDYEKFNQDALKEYYNLLKK